ncbi:hypothetical protein THAOC_06536 [Thalassiosira oceanica]|uniref:Uncharacterized protein n=1 Tax=Thalassiosira oceanica TaxID=159749 RepID=K0TEN8_THAOC|nr:hypothetical protein THAOC_06536 [Thalassiosira oceanica]|eukprot:EJK71976.1 hypothetical protein THAOC_06536 [Thalassiosira oceanica]
MARQWFCPDSTKLDPHSRMKLQVTTLTRPFSSLSASELIEMCHMDTTLVDNTSDPKSNTPDNNDDSVITSGSLPLRAGDLVPVNRDGGPELIPMDDADSTIASGSPPLSTGDPAQAAQDGGTALGLHSAPLHAPLIMDDGVLTAGVPSADTDKHAVASMEGSLVTAASPADVLSAIADISGVPVVETAGYTVTNAISIGNIYADPWQYLAIMNMPVQFWIYATLVISMSPGKSRGRFSPYALTHVLVPILVLMCFSVSSSILGIGLLTHYCGAWCPWTPPPGSTFTFALPGLGPGWESL